MYNSAPTRSDGSVFSNVFDFWTVRLVFSGFIGVLRPLVLLHRIGSGHWNQFHVRCFRG